MTSLFEAVPYLQGYHAAFLVVALLSLVTLLQNFLTAPLAYVKNEQVPGLPLRHDHGHLSFRAVRTYQNSAESLPSFLAALLAAVVAGVSPGLVNAVAMIYLAARLAFWGIYYSGVGKTAGGPRTLAFVACLLANLVLAGAAIWALI